MLEVLIVSIN